MPCASAFVLAAALAAPVAGQAVAEPQTGLLFPAASEGQSLLGLGLRVKKIAFVRVKVYVVALYVPDAVLAGPLADHRGRRASPALFDLLVRGDFEKRLVLRFVRDLGQEQIRNAMREALAPRADRGLLERFVSYFAPLAEGQECVLRWLPGGSLAVTMAGEERPALASRDFAAAVFGLYLGERPLQEDIKQGLVSRLETLSAPQ